MDSKMKDFQACLNEVLQLWCKSLLIFFLFFAMVVLKMFTYSWVVLSCDDGCDGWVWCCRVMMVAMVGGGAVA
jgi:hypothetical protein